MSEAHSADDNHIGQVCFAVLYLRCDAMQRHLTLSTAYLSCFCATPESY
jgi:hypothetical protein